MFTSQYVVRVIRPKGPVLFALEKKDGRALLWRGSGKLLASRHLLRRDLVPPKNMLKSELLGYIKDQAAVPKASIPGNND